MLHTTPNSHAKALAVLANFRQEWQQAAGDKSLLEIEGSIGMVLADLVNAFGLSRHEQLVVLGPELLEEMQDLLHLSLPN